MIKSVVALSLVVTLSACALLGGRRPVAEADLKTTKRLGVISTLGDTFHGVSIGTTVFNNESFSSPVPNWQVDKQAQDVALRLLRTNVRFETIAMSRESLATGQVSTDGERSKALWQAAASQGIDRIVIFRPGVSDNYRFFRPGYGFYERSMFGSSKRCVYVAYVAEVFDVATRSSLAWEWGGGEAPCRLGSDDSLPFKKQFSDYSAEETQTLARRLQERVSESVTQSLKTLMLVPPDASAN